MQKGAYQSAEQEKKSEALRTSIKEGSLSTVMSGVGDNYIQAFMIALTKNPLPIGLLSSLPGLLSPLAQVFGSHLMERKSRKDIVIKFVLLQSLLWLPIAGIALLSYFKIISDWLPYLLILCFSSVAIFGGVSGPSWFSWMGDLVNNDEKGAYFSKRNRTTGAIGLAAFLISAFILDAFKTHGFVMLGFALLFATASTFRMLSLIFFRKQYHPEFKLKEDYYFSFFQFLRRHGNYFKFTVFHAAINFAIMIASPFFAVYMLKELNFNYVTYTLVSMSSTIFSLIILPIAGKFSDKYGNKRLLFISTIAFGIYPLSWLFFKSPIWLILIPQLISGVSAATFSIGVTNYIYDTVTPQRRGICVAYLNVLTGIFIFLGGILGGLIVKSWHPKFMAPLMFLFLIGGLARLALGFSFFFQFKERRETSRLPSINKILAYPIKKLIGNEPEEY